MKNIFILLSLLLICKTSFSEDIRGNIENHLNAIIDDIPESFGNDYFIPSTSDLNNWNTLLTNIFNNNIESAESLASSLNYQLITLLDTTLTANNRFYILEEKMPQSKYWGTYVISIEPLRDKLIIQAPHPKYDTNTGFQAVYCFKRLIPRALFISGTHRCNHSQTSVCSGSTSVCGSSGAYKVSDMAHNTNSIFHISTQEFSDRFDNTVFLQLHGFAKGASDPFLIMSNGTRITPTIDYLSLIETELSKIDPTLTFKLAHIHQDWTRLIAFTNTQGRYINNSTDACTQNATNSEGRFIHIEQEKSRLREDSSGWNKMYLALKEVFPITNTGIYSPQNKKAKCYPNPNYGLFSIQLKKAAEIVIYNNKAEIVYHEITAYGSTKNIDLKGQTPGAYFINIKYKDEIEYAKIFILN